ncbi:coiled-coil domain-containing protein 153-like [Asterias rubens]|uniref:coiled-coil domain-containing protein 153-like n=1 Tax=Asterias rubens TaxID=7604 RepID=UPI001455CC24|nr:coiled-coil domain-containing protein 153-like [Asterias rubens]
MPPKKKGKGKGKKGKKKKKNDAELTIEDKYKQTLNEIEALKDHLSSRKDLARRSQSHSEEWKMKMKIAQEDLDQQKTDQRDVTSDMTRQYKTMQTEMGVRVHQLEADLAKTKTQLARTQHELKSTKEQKEQMTKEKDGTIAELEDKIKNMEFSYENMLHEALDNLVLKLDAAKKRWTNEATHIHGVQKEKLLEFGLNPLDI